MPPPLALLLCTAFVVTLLWAEGRRAESVSGALWIPTIWMLAIASKPLGVWFQQTGDIESGSALDRTMLTLLAVGGVLVLGLRKVDLPRVMHRHAGLLLLLLYMLVATIWSDDPALSVKRWFREGIVLIMALVVLSEPAPLESLESLFRRAAYILVPFSLVLIKYYPRLGVDYARWSGEQMWIGVTVHKNTLGRLCLVSIFVLLWTMIRGRRRSDSWNQRVLRSLPEASVAAIAAFLLRGADNAYSATSLVTLSVGLSGLFALSVAYRFVPVATRALALTSLLAAFALGAVTPFLGGVPVAGMTTSLGRNETLTGRTETWAELVPVFEQQPLLGSGFGSFWSTERRDYYRMSHGHNGYLDVLLDLGLIGLCFYAVWLASCARHFVAALEYDFAWASFGLCVLLMTLVYSTTESALNGLTGQLTATVLFASFVLPHRRRASVQYGARRRGSTRRDTGARALAEESRAIDACVPALRVTHSRSRPFTRLNAPGTNGERGARYRRVGTRSE